MSIPKSKKELKPWWQSKSLWFNTAVGVGTAIELSFHLVEGYFDPRVYLGLIGVVAGVNVVLRTITTQGVE